MNLQKKRVFLLDMDGTLYHGNRLIDGAAEFLRWLKQSGKRAVYFTNNSSKSAEKYVEKLRSLGIEATADDFVTSVHATEVFLKEKAYRKIYVLGTASMLEQLRSSGLPVTNRLEDGIDCLCIGFDTELTFSKLEVACILLQRGVAYTATHPDVTCPTEYGYVPDCGALAEALYRASGRKPEIIGKPQPLMAELARRKTGCEKAEMLVVGDRLYSDIACGVNAGIDTAFVLSGEGTEEDIERYGIRPSCVYADVKDLHEALRKDG